MKQTDAVAIIAGENHEVLRLRSGTPVWIGNTFRLAPLRMTDWEEKL